jgi:IS66 C-terminal element
MAPLQTAKLNDAEPMTWLTYVLTRIAEHPVTRVKFLNVGAPLRVSVRRIKAAMASACPWEDEFAAADCHRLIRTAQSIVTIQVLPTPHERAGESRALPQHTNLLLQGRPSWDLVR